jgi:hypothetical protein
MINLCPNRGCDACYDLGAADVGRTLHCMQCGALLEVEERGLRLLAPPAGEAGGAPARTSRQENAPMSSFVREGRSLGNVLATCLFTAGALLVVLFVFLPLIDQAFVARQAALVEAGDRREQRLDEELQARLRDGEGKDKDGRRKGREEDGRLERKEQKETWLKKKKALQAEVDDARTAARRSLYFYTCGMLLGFLCLAIGSISFLTASQSTPRKVVGAVVICAQVLLIFLLYLASSGLTRLF